MTDQDRQLIDALEAGQFLGDATHCACGAPIGMTRAFHRRQQCHDCVHHPRRSCGVCRAADVMLAGVDARLYIEVVYGPFIVTRWEKS